MGFMKNVVTWNTMIAGYVQCGEFVRAIDLFQHMLSEEVKPSEVTMVSLLSACAHLGALDMGEWIHGYIRTKKIKIDYVLGNVLIDMYFKCGNVEAAIQPFWVGFRWEKADQRSLKTTGGARHHCFAVECEREATLASGEENKVLDSWLDKLQFFQSAVGESSLFGDFMECAVSRCYVTPRAYTLDVASTRELLLVLKLTFGLTDYLAED
uniref:Pentatricopeptide repeat-containing protein n=1 Tax=Solanum tuberosum TaxID=4113 RepID=M1AET2_SOLTU